ncbi:MAG: sulfatase-like hydrolase/transferase [Myxococcota bacterium]
MSTLGLMIELAALAALALATRRLARPPWRGRIILVLKAYLTLRVFSLILLHRVNGQTITEILGALAQQLDLETLIEFSLLATGVRMVGIGASITRWSLMLRGQGIELPARHLVGAFFIGRFLGTFLPSTLGLDGYKLWDAARFSGRAIEVSTATAVEKILGASGIFGTFLIALPLGVSVFGAYELWITAIGIPLSLLPLLLVAIAFFWPGPLLIRWIALQLPLPTLRPALERIAESASAYSRRKGLLLAAWGLSLVTHFMTAATYYFTARALGVQPHEASFWQVTFASSIQILATVLSPFTIAGEGIRELAQGLLLQGQMTFAVAAASALLGFLVAEAPTLLGAIPWFLRGARYAPPWCRVGGDAIDPARARDARGTAPAGPERPTLEVAGVDPLWRRLATGSSAGLAGGLWGGVAIGLAETLYLLFQGKIVDDTQVFWAAPLAYGLLFGGAGALGGALIGTLPFPRSSLRATAAPLAWVGTVPYAALATLFFVYRDAYAEQMPPLGILAGILTSFGLLALVGGGATWLACRGRLASLLRAPAAVLGSTLLIAAAGALGAGIGPRAAGPSPARPAPARLAEAPNVLFVLVDTLRADELPAYGGSAIRTPAIDRLAREGTVFSAAFSQASWTKPAVASIMTSLYPTSHTATHKPSELPDSVDTLAEGFAAYGYTTAGIVTNVNLAPSFNFQQGFQDYRYLAPDYLFGAFDSTSRLLLYELARRVAGRIEGGVRPGQAYQPAGVVNRHALGWLSDHPTDRFLLYLHYMDPHDPYFAHPDDGHAIARSQEPEPDPGRAVEMHRRYRGEIEFFDRELGTLLEELDRRGLYDDLLIVLTADHGEEFQDHGGFWHGRTLYDELIGVPLIVKWPRGHRRAPARVEAQVRSIDIAPTLLALVGAPVPRAMQGDDLLASAPHERAAFAEEDHEGNVLASLRSRGWKLIRANPGNPRGLAPLELYHVAEDPGERSDVAAHQHARRTRLERDLAGMARLAASHSREERTVHIGQEECERLKALGYVDSCAEGE